MATAPWTYKCVAAPRRVKRVRGQRTPGEALAAAFESAIAEHAAMGWEYLRTDFAPVEAKTGWFGSRSESHEAVMVFRRPAARAVVGEDEPLGQGVAAPRRRIFDEDDPPADIPSLGAARIE